MQSEVTRGLLSEGLKLNSQPIGLQLTMPPYYQSCLFSKEIMIPVYPCKFHYFQPPMLHPSSLYKAPVFTLSLFHTKPREIKLSLVFSSCVNQFSFLLGINPFLFSSYMWGQWVIILCQCLFIYHVLYFLFVFSIRIFFKIKYYVLELFVFPFNFVESI